MDYQRKNPMTNGKYAVQMERLLKGTTSTITVTVEAAGTAQAQRKAEVMMPGWRAVAALPA